MKNLFLLISIFYSLQVFSQAKRVLVYDLKTKLVDTMSIIEFDTTILVLSDFTNFAIGNYNNSIEFLPESAPEMNFSKNIASIDFDLTNYPIRTSVKLFKSKNDTLSSLCSGSMVSRRHVLSAAHCVADNSVQTFFDNDIYVCPIFDNGVENSNFDCSYVTKVYCFENWILDGEDFAILELEKPIGDKTGWISIGFEENNEILEDGIFYKFSYPSFPILALDSTEYNGDTLNYSFGKIDILRPKTLAISGTYGIGGESGSSLIKVKNSTFYTSYGTLTFSHNLTHSRIKNWMFYAFENIIHDDLVLQNDDISIDQFEIYPNPTNNYLNIRHPSILKSNLAIYDVLGKEILNIRDFDFQNILDLTTLVNGVYFLNIVSGDEVFCQKIIKN